MHPEAERGVALFNARQYFECHEVLEALWHKDRGPTRLFIQSLIHVAVGLYHYQRSNPVGAVRQLRKGLVKLEGYLPSYEDLDTGKLHSDCAACLRCIEAGQPIPYFPNIDAYQVDRR